MAAHLDSQVRNSDDKSTSYEGENLRNPSPPPDVDELLPDKIGSTTFSKRAVLSALMHIASLVHERSISSQSSDKAFEKYETGRSDKPQSAQSTPQNDTKDSTTVRSESGLIAALNAKSVTFLASDLNFSPLRTSKHAFSPSHEITDASTQNGKTSDSSSRRRKPIALATVAGVTFSPVNFSSFTAFSTFKDRKPAVPVNNRATAEKEISTPESGESKTHRGNGRCKESPKAEWEEDEFVFSEDLEQEYCELVDMTIEKDVAAYLFQEKLNELLQYILFATDIPRIQELTLSIFANCACLTSIASLVLENYALLEMVMAMVHISSDAQVLAESFRLIITLICNATTDSAGEKRLISKLICYDIQSVVSFVLDNCLNDWLLRQVSDFVYLLINDFEHEFEDWFSVDFISKLTNLSSRLTKEIHDLKVLNSSMDVSNEHRSLIVTTCLKVFQKMTKSLSLVDSLLGNYSSILNVIELVSKYLITLNYDWIHEFVHLLRAAFGVALVLVFSHEESTQSALLLQCTNLCQAIRLTCCQSCDCASKIAEGEENNFSLVACISLKKAAQLFVSESLQLITAREDLLRGLTVFEGIEVNINEYPPRSN